MAEDLADDALGPPRFRPSRGWAAGYRREEVDRFVVDLRRAVRSEPPAMAPYEVADQRFPVARFRPRYSMRDVDEYLDRAEALLRERHRDDAVAGIQGQPAPPRSRAVALVYLLALLVVGAVGAFVLLTVR